MLTNYVKIKMKKLDYKIPITPTMTVTCNGCRQVIAHGLTFYCDCQECSWKVYCLHCTYICDRCGERKYESHRKFSQLDESGLCHTCYKHNESIKHIVDLNANDLKYMTTKLHAEILLTYENIKITREELKSVLYGILVTEK